jgi:hypothetical protein
VGDSGEAGEYALRVGGLLPLRLIPCVPRVVRDGALLQTFHHTVDTVCRDNLVECYVCFDELPVCVRIRMCVGMCG